MRIESVEKSLCSKDLLGNLSCFIQNSRKFCCLWYTELILTDHDQAPVTNSFYYQSFVLPTGENTV